MVVPALIDRALAMLPAPAYLQSLAPIIGCAYQNLWSVYRGIRPLPALKVRNLCNFIGLSADECFAVLADQEGDWQRIRSEAQAAAKAEDKGDTQAGI